MKNIHFSDSQSNLGWANLISECEPYTFCDYSMYKMKAFNYF